MDVLGKIVTAGEKAINELNSLKQWSASATNTMKYIVERLNMCFDEILFQLQKKNLHDEASVITKLYHHFNTLFLKVEELNSRKPVNAPDLPMEFCSRSFSQNHKAVFGGTEIQSFGVFAAEKAKFITAEQEYRSIKTRIRRNTLNKATDTGEDAAPYLNSEYLGEKERELQKVKDENELNLREIEKFLKIKGTWSELTQSNASYKLMDLGKILEREYQRNEMFVNEYMIASNQVQDIKPKDMKNEIKEQIVLGVQRQTAEKIFKVAEKKMKEEFEKFQLKNKTGLQMHKRKSQNMSRIDELQNLINQKNEEILEKESKISSLVGKFEDQEKKLFNLLIQMEQIKSNEKLNTFTSNQANEKQVDVELQVSLNDPKIFRLELQIQEIAEENKNIKAELDILHEQAKQDKQKVLIQPQLIEEVLMMILQSELQAEGKIELLQTFLQYLIDNSENDIGKMPPNELYKAVKQKMYQNANSNRNLEEVLNKFEEMQSDNDEFSSPGSIKKQKKSKSNKQIKSKKLIVEKVETSQIEPFNNTTTAEKSEKQQTTVKKAKTLRFENENSNENSESQVLLNNESNNNISTSIMKKKPIQITQSLNQITEEQSIKQTSTRKQQIITPTSSSRNNQNNLNNPSQFKKQQNINVSDIKDNKSGVNSSKESSRFRTEQQKPQISSGRQKIDINSFIKEEKDRASAPSQQSLQSQSTPQFVKKMVKQIKSRVSYKDEEGEIDCEEIDDEIANKGVQVNFQQQTSQTFYNAQKTESHSQPGFQTPQMKQSYRSIEEKISSKSTQTDDFFMWNLFQKMQVDLGLSEEQIKKLEQIFLNEQQFIHYYEKDPQLRSRQSRNSTIVIDQNTKIKQESAANDSKMTTAIQQKNETADSEIEKRRPTISITKSTLQKNIDSPMNQYGYGRQKSQVLLSYTNDSSAMLGNPGRSVSQTSDVHIMNYASVSPNPKKQRHTTSQKILEDMLKNKTGLTTPFDIETKEIKEQQMYFHVFGDEMYTDADFELEAIRMNMGKPLEVIQDHLKEEAMKKIYQQFINRSKNPWQDQLYMIISQFANKPQQAITYIDFKKYYENYMKIHKRCGDGCIHMQRFLARIGFGIVNKRKTLNMSKQSVSPFGQLPKLK